MMKYFITRSILAISFLVIPSPSYANGDEESIREIEKMLNSTSTAGSAPRKCDSSNDIVMQGSSKPSNPRDELPDAIKGSYEFAEEHIDDFYPAILNRYAPRDKVHFEKMMADSCDHSEVRKCKDKSHIRKYGFDRILTHFLLSEAIDEVSARKIRLVEKHIAVKPKGDQEPHSYEKTNALIKTPEFKNWVKKKIQQRAGLIVPTKNESDFDVMVLAKREPELLQGHLKIVHWSDLKGLSYYVNWDVGYDEMNFAFDKSNNIVIFDTEMGAQPDYRNVLIHIAQKRNWSEAEKRTIDDVNKDFDRWSTQFAEEEQIKKARKRAN